VIGYDVPSECFHISVMRFLGSQLPHLNFSHSSLRRRHRECRIGRLEHLSAALV
jgi:hypothetical protein